MIGSSQDGWARCQIWNRSEGLYLLITLKLKRNPPVLPNLLTRQILRKHRHRNRCSTNVVRIQPQVQLPTLQMQTWTKQIEHTSTYSKAGPPWSDILSQAQVQRQHLFIPTGCERELKWADPCVVSTVLWSLLLCLGLTPERHIKRKSQLWRWYERRFCPDHLDGPNLTYK